MTDSLDDEDIDDLALDVERTIAQTDSFLEDLPDFEYGQWVREQESKAKAFFEDIPGVVVDE